MLKVKDRAALQVITGEKQAQAAAPAPVPAGPDPMAGVHQALQTLTAAVAQNAAATAKAQQGMADAIKKLADQPKPEPKKIKLKATVERDRDGKMQTVIITSN
jgi:regulator of protease activity HflC (stomatin/prohibitin superfamily)